METAVSRKLVFGIIIGCKSTIKKPFSPDSHTPSSSRG